MSSNESLVLDVKTYIEVAMHGNGIDFSSLKENVYKYRLKSCRNLLAEIVDDKLVWYDKSKFDSTQVNLIRSHAAIHGVECI